MDLGYTDQVVWNTLHRRPFEFSTYENSAIDLPLETFARTDHLLGYHVEALLAPIAPLYLLHSGPETLLVLQAVVIGLGALPAFLLARRRTGSDAAGLAFAAAYLLAPALQGAVLSDFHAVALTASLLLWAFYFFDTARWAAYFACIVTAMLAKEDIPLVIALMGLGIVILGRQRAIGAATLALGTSWFVIANRIILPHYSGLARSPFFDRLALFGPSPEASLRAAIQDPMLVVEWLLEPEITTYLGGLLGTSGFMSTFGLPLLLPAAPVLGINVFSAWDWTYSEGAHYSASIIPFIILSGVFGLNWLAGKLARGDRTQRHTAIGILAGLMLAVALAHHILVGVSPATRDFEPPRVTDHERIGLEFMALIPGEAAVSAQSDLYPHLSQRRKAYLFPAINDADYVLVDVAGSAYPLAADAQFWEIQSLLESGEFGIQAAKDGYLLLRRGATGRLDGGRLADFLTFAHAGGGAPRIPARARFGDDLELIGYDYEIRPVVHATERPATIATYWRALRPLSEEYDFRFAFTRSDGAIVYQYDGPLAATLWYPTSVWAEDETIRIETPVLAVGRLHDVLVAVSRPAEDGAGSAELLAPAPSGGTVEVVGDGTLLKVFSFR
jgi:uncharacterized membrane protein